MFPNGPDATEWRIVNCTSAGNIDHYHYHDNSDNGQEKPSLSIPTDVDMNNRPENSLEALPHELVHHICSYVLPTHEPNRSTLADSVPSGLTQLAATGRSLHMAVEAYSRTTLLKWAGVTKSDGKLPKSKKSKKSFRGILTRFTRKHCVFCGAKSQRKAILRTGFGCCAQCDRKEWPDKIVRVFDRVFMTDGLNSFPILRLPPFSSFFFFCFPLHLFSSFPPSFFPSIFS